MKALNLVGKKFGALTVILPYNTTSYKKRLWICECDCGKFTEAVTGHLMSGARVSCGCQIHRRDKVFKIEDLCAREILRQYKKNARYRKKYWKLDEQQVKELIFKPCHYCGTIGSNTYTEKGRNKTYNKNEKQIQYNGIDRKNNKLGYTIKNSTPCCNTCNRMKGVLSIREFKTHIKKINNYRKNT